VIKRDNSGAVVQLGERLTGSQEVTGSNPVGSMKRQRYGGKMNRMKYFLVVLIGIIVLSCVPTSTTSTTEPGVDNKEKAQQEYSIAYEYYKQGKFDDAIVHFNEAIKLDPQFFAAYLALAKAYLAKNDVANAEAMYNKAKQIDPGDPRSYEGIGTIYFRYYQNYDKAIAEFQSGLQVDPTSVDLLNGLAACYTKKKDYNKALEYYRKSEQIEPENIETMFASANVYIEMGEPTKAIPYLEEVVAKKPNVTDVRKKLAETLVNLKRYDEALEQYTFLLEKEPDNYYYHLQKGLVYQRQRKYSSAEKSFNDAKRLAPDKALPLFYIADLYIVQGKLSKAESTVKEAQQLEPNNVYAYVLLGDVYERWGMSSKTTWDKNKSKKNCGILNSTLSYFNTAISYYTKAKADVQYASYANTEINRCNTYIKALQEDKWFYCKEGG
jgi:tetratricopeptide (TPR) repeat protein